MNTAGLEWFGPPERNTLRPLSVVLLVSESLRARVCLVFFLALAESVCMCVLAGVFSLLYVQREHVH